MRRSPCRRVTDIGCVSLPVILPPKAAGRSHGAGKYCRNSPHVYEKRGHHPPAGEQYEPPLHRQFNLCRRSFRPLVHTAPWSARSAAKRSPATGTDRAHAFTAAPSWRDAGDGRIGDEPVEVSTMSAASSVDVAAQVGGGGPSLLRPRSVQSAEIKPCLSLARQVPVLGSGMGQEGARIGHGRSRHCAGERDHQSDP